MTTELIIEKLKTIATDIQTINNYVTKQAASDALYDAYDQIERAIVILSRVTNKPNQ